MSVERHRDRARDLPLLPFLAVAEYAKRLARRKTRGRNEARALRFGGHP